MKLKLNFRYLAVFSLILALLWACKTADTPTPTPTTKSSAKDITKFSFAALSPAVDATIDATAKTISATVPAATDLTKLVPTITISDKATVSPASGVAQDFSKEVSYTVTAEDASTVVWKVNVVRATAVVTTTDFIYAGQSGSKTTLIAFDAITGKKVWEFIPNAAANTSAYSSPFVSDGIVYIAGADKNMYAVDAKTGVKVWEYLTNTTTYPTSANGVLYCTGNEGIFYALDAKNGTKKWSVNLTNTGLSTPVVVNNIVYTSSTTSGTSGVVYALDAATGQTKWKQASNVTSSDVCVANDLVFITNGDYGITALDANTGIVKWKVGDSKNAANANKQTILDGILYTAVYNSSSIIAMDAKTGERKWITNLGTTGSSGSPIGADGLIYHVDSKYTCYAIDGVTGTIKWSVANLDFVDFNPVVVNNLIYTKSEALDAKTGASKLKFARIATTGDLAFWINGKAYHSSRSGSVQ